MAFKGVLLLLTFPLVPSSGWLCTNQLSWHSSCFGFMLDTSCLTELWLYNFMWGHLAISCCNFITNNLSKSIFRTWVMFQVCRYKLTEPTQENQRVENHFTLNTVQLLWNRFLGGCFFFFFPFFFFLLHFLWGLSCITHLFWFPSYPLTLFFFDVLFLSLLLSL